MRITHFDGYELVGHEELTHHAGNAPARTARLFRTIEQFLRDGPVAATRLYPRLHISDAAVVVSAYLIPPRAVLRGVPEMGAIMFVDAEKRTVALTRVLESYGGDDDAEWVALCQEMADLIESDDR